MALSVVRAHKRSAKSCGPKPKTVCVDQNAFELLRVTLCEELTQTLQTHWNPKLLERSKRDQKRTGPKNGSVSERRIRELFKARNSSQIRECVKECLFLTSTQALAPVTSSPYITRQTEVTAFICLDTAYGRLEKRLQIFKILKMPERSFFSG